MPPHYDGSDVTVIIVSAVFVDFDIFQSNNSIMYPAYYDNMS